MMDRSGHLQNVLYLLKSFPVVSIVGARQVGKTTLAHLIADRVRTASTMLDLENPSDLERLSDPMMALKGLKGLVILDEIQRLPDLFPVLRVLADRPARPARFLILGSASRELVRNASESLAGRIATYELSGFNLAETGVTRLDRLWFRGGFPPSYLASSDAQSAEWRRQFIHHLLERDLPSLGISIPAMTLRRLWTMVAHTHGQVLNSTEYARSFGLADTTIRRYLDILTGTFVIRLLPPWHANVKKRQVRSPKVFVADSGLLHALLGIPDLDQLLAHPKLGASWEGFAMDTVSSLLGIRPEEAYFWATHAGAELDLLWVRGEHRVGFEFKRSESPGLTPSMKSALSDLDLKHLWVVHTGDRTYPIGPKVTAIPLKAIPSSTPSIHREISIA